MKTLISTELAKTSMTEIWRRCLPALFCAALSTVAGAQTEQVTFNFSATKTGDSPSWNNTVVQPNGHVIGTANGGGKNGVVFEAVPPTATDPNWAYRVIYRFKGEGNDGADGSAPWDGLTLGKKGVLYGMTYFGGPYNGSGGCGVVYQMTQPAQSSTGKWEESVLYSFSANGQMDGCGPLNSQLLYDKTTGSLYGTTTYGGTGVGQEGYGTLFRLNPPARAGDPWTETLLYSFSGLSDGAYPSGGLAGDPDGGIIYGTAAAGGSSTANAGVVWGYNTSTGEMTTVYTFLGGSDGAGPQGVIGPFPYNPYGSDYYLLGTTSGGGGADCDNGCGTVYAINMPAAQAVTKTVLHAFQGGTDGDEPATGLAAIGSGYWGTTEFGGSGLNCETLGCGTLFEIQVSGLVSHTLSYVSVYSFQGGTTDGATPETGLVGNSAGNIYGTTAGGGANGVGTFFQYVP
jgi:uncharacterized repeat protein (TIGR03803 family)